MTARELETSDLIKENFKLREENEYLTQKCADLMGAMSDDALVALLKNKINKVEVELEETEMKYETEVHSLKKKLNEALKESNQLRLALGKLEKTNSLQNTQLMQSRQDEISVEENQDIITELKKALQEKDYLLQEAYKKLRSKDNSSNIQNNDEQNSQRSIEGGSQKTGSSGPVKPNPASLRRFIRDRKTAQYSRPTSRENSSMKPQDLIGGLGGDEELKKALANTLEEKAKLEAINAELCNRLIADKSNTNEPKTSSQDPSSKQNDYQILTLKKQIEELKAQKDENEKKLLDKIVQLESKIQDREENLKILGSGVEQLRKELSIKDDPSYNAVQLIRYLEKFSKYQNEFVTQEVARFQEEFNKLKADVKQKEQASASAQSQSTLLAARHSELTSELQMKSEILKIKEDEISSLKLQVSQLMTGMEILKTDRSQASNMKKAYTDMVKSW